MEKDQFLKLARKYHSPEARYNYYPRISNWEKNLSSSEWMEDVFLSIQENPRIDLYIHIPFCHKFCHFCGCNTKVTSEKNLIDNYILELIKEWNSYDFNESVKLGSVYFGGGTPNAISKEQVRKIIDTILPHVDSKTTITCEYDPRLNTLEFIHELKRIGNPSLSIGIQSFNKDTLVQIGRETNFELVNQNLRILKETGHGPLFIDIIYGIDNKDHRENSISEFLTEFDVEGVSLYPFAKVPWFNDFNPSWQYHRPNLEQKALKYFTLFKTIENQGYSPISFGHFFKKEGPFYKKYLNNELRRNIMGHCLDREITLIGLGVSAISSTKNCLKQNQKIFESYTFSKSKFSIGHKRNEQQKQLEESFQMISSTNKVNPHIFGQEIREDFFSQNKLNPYAPHFIQYLCKSIE